MPRINLLPMRAARRRLTAKNEMLAMFALVAATVAGLVFWHTTTESEIGDLEHKLEAVTAEIGTLEAAVKGVERLKKQEQKVKKKVEVIKSLTTRKVGPARMLHELAVIMTRETKRVWLTSLTEAGGTLRLTGGAMEREDIAEFQLALERREMFSNVQLQRVTTTKDANVEFLKWELACTASFTSG